MQKVNILFGEFVEELKKKKNRKNLLRTAESLYRDIELNRNEIKCPTDLEELLRSTRTKKEKKRDLLIDNVKDHLRGLKENVLIGKLLPAGTGLRGPLKSPEKLAEEENYDEYDILGIDSDEDMIQE